MKQKTYDITVNGELVGFVNAESELIYSLDGNSTIGRLNQAHNQIIADKEWHRQDLDGQSANVYLVPDYREYNYKSGKMEVVI